MKKILLSGLLLTGLIYSCKKDDSNKDKFTCDITPSTLPSNDSGGIFMPNAFSPNNDGLNDALRPIIKNIQSIEWSIYDQKNNQLYTTTDPTALWVGPSDPGKGMTWYHYKIKAVSNQGNTYSTCGSVCTFSCIPAGYNGVDTLVFSDQCNPNMPSGYLTGISQEASVSFFPCQ